MKRTAAWFLIFLLLFSLPTALAESVMETLEIAERESVKLSNDLLPETAKLIASHKNVSWQSSDPDIATVDRGYVLRAKRTGECIMTGTDDGREIASFRVVVKPGAPLEGHPVTVTAFTALKLKEASDDVKRILSDYSDLTWESSDPAIAIVNHSNVLYGKKEGTCEIYALEDGMSVAKLDVTVTFNSEVEEKFIAFTFDDGPSKPTWTILDTLDEYGIKATFFMVGEMVDMRPSTVLAVYEAGHEIGNHTYNHYNLDNLSYERARREIEKTDEAIFKITGENPTVIRAPGGDLTVKHSEEYYDGRYFIYWTLGTGDWKSRDTDKVCSVVRNKHHNHAVVLMHDLYPTTAKAVKKLVPELILKGYTFVTVSEMIEITGEPEGKIYAK
ncbi:MAG: hypothetical protein E7335_07545 [Clostridiales bacterium]|nr:hypothetical protein [Clostridiales bacterium]